MPNDTAKQFEKVVYAVAPVFNVVVDRFSCHSTRTQPILQQDVAQINQDSQEPDATTVDEKQTNPATNPVHAFSPSPQNPIGLSSTFLRATKPPIVTPVDRLKNMMATSPTLSEKVGVVLDPLDEIESVPPASTNWESKKARFKSTNSNTNFQGSALNEDDDVLTISPPNEEVSKTKKKPRYSTSDEETIEEESRPVNKPFRGRATPKVRIKFTNVDLGALCYIFGRLPGVNSPSQRFAKIVRSKTCLNRSWESLKNKYKQWYVNQPEEKKKLLIQQFRAEKTAFRLTKSAFDEGHFDDWIEEEEDED